MLFLAAPPDQKRCSAHYIEHLQQHLCFFSKSSISVQAAAQVTDPSSVSIAVEKPQSDNALSEWVECSRSSALGRLQAFSSLLPGASRQVVAASLTQPIEENRNQSSLRFTVSPVDVRLPAINILNHELNYTQRLSLQRGHLKMTNSINPGNNLEGLCLYTSTTSHVACLTFQDGAMRPFDTFVRGYDGVRISESNRMTSPSTGSR